MTTTTAKYGITKPAGTDLVRSGDDHIRAAMDRIDLLLGESGTKTITPSAINVDTSVRVDYARSYAALAPVVPQPMICLNESVPSTQTVNIWPSAPDATGFTLNIRSASTTSRNIRWRAGV